MAKKCKRPNCKHDIKDIDLYKDDYIVYENGIYHVDCWIDKVINKKKNKLTYDEALKMTSKLIVESKDNEIFKIKEDERKKQEEVDKKNNGIIRKQLTDWLGFRYNITKIPDRFYIKLSNIINGTYKGMTREVPISDIFDMWKLRVDYLDKVNFRNKSKGKILTPIQRLDYDLEIILRNYENYLEWKNKQFLEQKENDNKIDANVYDMVSKNVDANIKHESNDIADILDELF